MNKNKLPMFCAAVCTVGALMLGTPGANAQQSAVAAQPSAPAVAAEELQNIPLEAGETASRGAATANTVLQNAGNAATETLSNAKGQAGDAWQNVQGTLNDKASDAVAKGTGALENTTAPESTIAPISTSAPVSTSAPESSVQELRNEPVTGNSGNDNAMREPGVEVPEQLYDMRGDNGVLENFRPSGVTFISWDRVLVCDGNEQRLHIFDVQGRRFKRLNVPHEISAPNYAGLAKLSEENFLAIGSHYHSNNYQRYLDSRSVMHLYNLRGELLTDESAKLNYDPLVALRKTGLLGTMTEKHMQVSGLAVDPSHNKLYISLSHPIEEDGTAIFYEGNLEEILAKDAKTKLFQHSYGIVPRVDPLTEQFYRVADICHVQDRGLLILMSSTKRGGYVFGSNQLWFKPDDSEEAYLVAEDIAPGNRGAGVAAISVDGGYNVAITFDNDPGMTSTPSRFMLLEGVNF